MLLRMWGRLRCCGGWRVCRCAGKIIYVARIAMGTVGADQSAPVKEFN
jgi:hypothetical protein